MLEYNFFRIYSQYLILYSPQSNINYNSVSEKSSLSYSTKHIYVIEVIEFILEQLANGNKTKKQIMSEYRIPRTTIYRWLNKYGNQRKMIKKNNLEKKGTAPDYKKIYNDIINIKYPEKREKCNHLLSKNILSTLDIIEISRILFNKVSKENFAFNQKHRSYDTSTIIKILEYQKENNLNNSELARHFNLSRNTITKWKNRFLI